MANIMVTDSCNLHCPYCFANEFVNKDRNEITEEAFEKAVDFILGDGSQHRIGLIGGEPTTHSHFAELLKKVISDKRVYTIMLYTNGVLLDKYWDLVTHKKVHMLINCNAPEDIGQKAYDRLCQNLEYLYKTRLFGDNLTLGINLYKPDFDYAYLLDLLKKYNQHHVRISITVPNMDSNRNCDAHAYFKRMKPRVLQFFHDLMRNDIIPNWDCNKMPPCLVSEDDIEQFNAYMNQTFIRENLQKSNISDGIVRCGPVIDIRQDLTAVRCFGLSEVTKEKISDFETISDLMRYYMRTIDAYAFNSVYSAQCAGCKNRKTGSCTGGCLAFKINEILTQQRFADERIAVFSERAGA